MTPTDTDRLTSAVTGRLAADAQRVTQWLEAWFARQDAAADRLAEAMSHGVLNGGKRLRASLVLSAARLATAHASASDAKAQGQPKGQPEAIAAAVEMLHAYSLIHDDLPAMDDAELRRGLPAAHIAFDEATAILAGDALQTAAFEILASADTHPDAEIRCQLVSCLAKASGLAGMAGGQMLDLQAEKTRFSLDQTTQMQAMKTGALIRAATVMGGIAGGASETMISALADYADAIGLAFQLADDLLDYQAESTELGKPAGRDAEAGKASYVHFYGVEGTREKAEALVEEAAKALAPFAIEAEPLLELAQFSINRTH